MKKNNFLSQFSIVGYFLFLIPLLLTVSIGTLIFHALYVANFSFSLILFYLVLYVCVASLLFTFFDIIRRRYMVEKPVEQILSATQKIATGDFNTKLNPLHPYNKYDEYDLIIENINKMAQELSKHEILKSEFISNLSHEIKTPLAVIQNYTKALQTKNLPPETQKKYLETLLKNSKKLSNLVTNILKLNKLENQSIIMQKTNVNVGELLRESVLQFEDLIESKNMTLSCNISDTKLYIDPSFLEIIFNNLISNAIKFTENGGKINIALIPQKERIIFYVKDNGCGMNKETGARIFEKFYQGDTSRSAEGNGLGLALVKRVIDIMGGEISVQSEELKGSTFTVILKRK